MASRSSSSVVMMTALVFTWFSYFLLWLCFPSRIPTSATAESIAAAPSVLVKQRVEYPARSDGVIFVSHAASGPAREAVYVLARFGYQVVVGVKNDLERRSYLYSLRKGIELIQFDISDPSTYPTLIYRLRHIRRDLDRPIVGLLINLADELKVSKMKAKDAIDVAYLDERYRAVTKNPFRIIQALLELNRHQIDEGLRSRRHVTRDAWLPDKALAAENNNNTSATASKYPWNAEAFRITILTRDYSVREAVDSTFLCDLDCLQQQFLVNYVRTLLHKNTELVQNATMSVVQSGWEVSSVQAAATQSKSTAGDIIGFSQGIDWTMDLAGEVEQQQGLVEEENNTQDQSGVESTSLSGGLIGETQIKRALVHSFVSRRPWSDYTLQQYQEKEIPLPRFPK